MNLRSHKVISSLSTFVLLILLNKFLKINCVKFKDSNFYNSLSEYNSVNNKNLNSQYNYLTDIRRSSGKQQNLNKLNNDILDFPDEHPIKVVRTYDYRNANGIVQIINYIDEKDLSYNHKNYPAKANFYFDEYSFPRAPIPQAPSPPPPLPTQVPAPTVIPITKPTLTTAKATITTATSLPPPLQVNEHNRNFQYLKRNNDYPQWRDNNVNRNIKWDDDPYFTVNEMKVNTLQNKDLDFYTTNSLKESINKNGNTNNGNSNSNEQIFSIPIQIKQPTFWASANIFDQYSFQKALTNNPLSNEIDPLLNVENKVRYQISENFQQQPPLQQQYQPPPPPPPPSPTSPLQQQYQYQYQYPQQQVQEAMPLANYYESYKRASPVKQNFKLVGVVFVENGLNKEKHRLKQLPTSTASIDPLYQSISSPHNYNYNKETKVNEKSRKRNQWFVDDIYRNQYTSSTSDAAPNQRYQYNVG